MQIELKKEQFFGEKIKEPPEEDSSNIPAAKYADCSRLTPLFVHENNFVTRDEAFNTELICPP